MNSYGLAPFATVLLMALAAAPAIAAPVKQTIVLIRHAEKPPGGQGRLDCRGLNRAAALPAVIAREVGRPDAIFAPDPSHLKKDDGTKYPYRRPLQTIEPTAKILGQPVDTRFGYKQIGKLEEALGAPGLAGATVLVAWEHKELVKLTRALLRDNGGDEASVPRWRGTDFDSIYLVTIERDGSRSSATFERRSQGLDGQPDRCPPGLE